jgi:hypothetical protein
MKNTASCLFLVLALFADVLQAAAQGTAFTYQGHLTDGAQPANGSNYGMVFYLYDAPANGNLLGNLGIPSITVSNGLFATSLDFGSQFDGAPRWLEISVQKNGGAFTTLSPRQPILPVPYAIFANTASNLSGPVSLGQLPASVVINDQDGVNLSGSFSGDGENLKNLNPMNLASGNVGAQLFFNSPFNYFNGGFNGTFNGNGNALTNLNPMNLASGNVGAQLFFNSPFNYFNGGFNGTFSGNGNALTNLNPMNLASGNVGAQLFFNSPFNYFNGGFNGTFSGDGSGLTNLAANAITGGISTNIVIGTHTLYITNGIIVNVQ